MTDTPEPRSTIDFAAVIRSYGDQRHAEGYAQAVVDVVAMLNAQQHGRTSDTYPGYYANEITRRFGKGQDHD